MRRSTPTARHAKKWVTSLPDDDPRFAELLQYLTATQTLGRYSPVPRMLGEWALLGFLFQTGKLSLGGGPAVDVGHLDLDAVRAEVEAIERGAGLFRFE